MNIRSLFEDYRVSTVVVCLLLSLLTAFVTAERIESRIIEKSIDKLSKRVALDLPELRLANPIFNQTADEPSIRYYIQSLNNHLAASDLPLRLLKIQSVGIESQKQWHEVTVQLESARQPIKIVIGTEKGNVAFVSLLLPIAFSMLVGFLVYLNDKKYKAKKQISQPAFSNIQSKLVVDLHERKLYLSEHSQTQSCLSNKPLCFYLAMLRYCQDNPEAKLYHNKNLPEDFIELANKYFYRLLELGHSRRKRPDFDSNVDKMLSEIRAALDEILAQEIELKNKFYPQKAQGEGSRSKLHNFALVDLESEDFELIGN